MILYNQRWIKWQKIYMGKDIEPYGWCAWPFIFFRDSRADVSGRMIRHEMYHYKRQCRLLWFPFVYDIGYLYLWLKHGYWDHPWEKLAREAE